MKIFLSAALLGLVAFAACNPRVNEAVNPGVSVPMERRSECEANCGSLGMRLGSVVLIMNSVGCVCVPADSPPATASDNSASAVSGGAMIAVAAEIAAQEQRNAAARRTATTPTTTAGHH